MTIDLSTDAARSHVELHTYSWRINFVIFLHTYAPCFCFRYCAIVISVMWDNGQKLVFVKRDETPLNYHICSFFCHIMDFVHTLQTSNEHSFFSTLPGMICTKCSSLGCRCYSIGGLFRSLCLLSVCRLLRCVLLLGGQTVKDRAIVCIEVE